MIDLVLEGPRRVVRRRARRPRRPGAGCVVVRVDCVSLCGSDASLFAGTYGGPRRYPIRFGHEWAGEVVEVGPDSSMRRGTRVTGDCSRWCGACPMCRVDRNLCRSVEKFGITVDGFSSRYRVVSDRYLYQDGHGLDVRLLALTELFAVALHGTARAANTLPAARALVVGAGPLGLATTLALRDRHDAIAVDVLERDAVRAARAAELFPGIELVEPPAGKLLAGRHSYRRLASLERYPVVFDCSGSADGLNSALTLAERGGRVITFGLGRPSRVRTDLVVSKALVVQGTIGGTGSFPDALRLLARNRNAARRMITHRFPAAQAREAFETAIGDGSRIKVQLDLEDGSR